MSRQNTFTPGVARKLFASNQELIDAIPYESMHEFFIDFHSAVANPTSVTGSIVLIRVMKLVWNVSRDNIGSMKKKFKALFGAYADDDCRQFAEDIETINNQANDGLFVIDQTIRDACSLFNAPLISGRRPFYTSGETKGDYAMRMSKRIFQMADHALIQNKILPCAFEEWFSSPNRYESNSDGDNSSSATPPVVEKDSVAEKEPVVAKEPVTEKQPLVENVPTGPIYPTRQVPRGQGKMPRSIPAAAGSGAATDGRPRGKFSKAVNFTPSMDRLLTLQEDDEVPSQSTTAGNKRSRTHTEESSYHPSLVSVAGVPVTHIPPAPPQFSRQQPVDDTPSPKRRRTLRHDDPTLFGVHVRRETLAEVFLHLGMAMQTLYQEFADDEDYSDDM